MRRQTLEGRRDSAGTRVCLSGSTESLVGSRWGI